MLVEQLYVKLGAGTNWAITGVLKDKYCRPEMGKDWKGPYYG